MLAFHCDKTNIVFIYTVLNGSLDVTELLSAISFRVPSKSTRSQSKFDILTHHTSYIKNKFNNLL